MKTFINRCLSSAFFVLLVIYTIFIAPSWFFSLVAMSLIVLALYEFYTMVEKRELFVYRYVGIILGILVPLSFHLRMGMVIQNGEDIEPLLIVIVSIFTVMVQMAKPDTSHALKRMSVTLFGILYISWFFSFIIKIKYLPHGAGLAALLIAVTKGGDMGAYVVGSVFGKHALIPRISPKKSVEGLVGGLLISLGIALCAAPFLSHYIRFYHFLILGPLLGMLGQLGDLAESLIKRDCGVKDASLAFPGLGGALDVLDSLLFTTPVFYFYSRMFF